MVGTPPGRSLAPDLALLLAAERRAGVVLLLVEEPNGEEKREEPVPEIGEESTEVK